jgi:hypothetical protein
MKNDIFSEMASCHKSTVIARSEVKRFTGGGISPKTLANADSKGVGPKGRFKIGRQTCYPLSSFIEWLRQRGRR